MTGEWLDISKELSRARQPPSTALTANMVLLKSNGQAHTYLTARGQLASQIDAMADKRCTIQIAASHDRLRIAVDGGEWIWGRAGNPKSTNLAYRICIGVITQWPGEYRRATACKLDSFDGKEAIVSLPDRWATSWGSGHIVPSKGEFDFPEYIGNVRLSLAERFILKQVLSGARTNVEYIGERVLLDRAQINTIMMRLNRALRGPVFKGQGLSIASSAIALSAADKAALQGAIVAAEADR